MKVHEFLLHHGIDRNPFAEEDAQSDSVFKQYCIHETRHPAWDKIYGNPSDPATSVVFGEKGSGKTALGLQMIDHVQRHNRAHPDRRVFVIEYNDFNPFLDRFRERLGTWSRRDDRVLSDWRLWDHMDAILSVGVTRLVDTLLDEGRPHGAAADPFGANLEQLAVLARPQRRDLLLLTAFYDQSPNLPMRSRWHRLRRRLKFRTWIAQWDLALGVILTLAAIAGAVYFFEPSALLTPWPWLAAAVGWLPWVARWLHRNWMAWQVQRQLRVVNHHVGALRHVLMQLGRRALENQPIPSRNRSDDRYELLVKFQTTLRTLGFGGIMVVMDRVDEPHLMGGSPERMQAFVWPMLDNKFLKHPGLGIKLLLPIELGRLLSRQDTSFYERSRLDKQNLINSLEWSGEALYDVANDRIHACRMEGAGNERITLRALFDPSITESDLIARLARLRVPRHLFKFLHRLLVDHCNSFSESNPRWTIGPETLHATHAIYLRDLEAIDRGLGVA